MPLILLSAVLYASSISLKVSKSALDRFNILFILFFSVFNPLVSTTSAERAVDVSVLKPFVSTNSAARAVEASLVTFKSRLELFKEIDVNKLDSVEREVDVSVLKSLVNTNSAERAVDISVDNP